MDAVSKKLPHGRDDAFALVVEKKETAEKALEAILERCRLALEGVPKETRRARDDGTTEFMRPLPGSARMYPETDEPLVPITDKKISETKKKRPKLPEERLEEFKKLGLSHELANQLVRSRFIEGFEEFAGKFKNLKPSLIATTLLATPKEIKKRYGIEPVSIEIHHYHDVLKAVNEGRISKESIPEIIADIAKEAQDIEKAIKKKVAKVSLQDIEKDIDRIIDENIEFVRSMGERAVGPLIGKAMTQFKGRVDGNEISRIVWERLKKVK